MIEVEAGTHHVQVVSSCSPATVDRIPHLEHFLSMYVGHLSVVLPWRDRRPFAALYCLHYFHHFNVSIRKSKLRMPIPHIIQVLLPVPIISPAAISNPILSPQPKIKYRARDTAQPDHAEGDAVAQGVRGCLRGYEDVGGDDATEVADADLEGGGDGAFIVTADILGMQRVRPCIA